MLYYYYFGELSSTFVIVLKDLNLSCDYYYLD